MSATASESEEWVVSKKRLFETETGKNLADYYYERILERECDREGKDREQCIREWMEGFDYIRVDIWPDDERVRYAFHTADGHMVDEYYEYVDEYFDADEIMARIVADLRRAVEN
jgi:hypothetical protein